MYRLAPGISFCTVGERLLFLDVLRDRYFCLAAASERSFRRLMSDEELLGEDCSRLDALVGHILVQSEILAPPRACPSPPKPDGSLVEDSEISGLRAAARALVNYGRARCDLRWRGLAASLAAARSAKARMRPRSEATGPATDAMTRKVAAAFRRAARWSSTHDECLAHSIAVARSLYSHGVAADLIIAVRLQPFRAHCWVQHRATLINDRSDNVRDFTPILVI